LKKSGIHATGLSFVQIILDGSAYFGLESANQRVLRAVMIGTANQGRSDSAEMVFDRKKDGRAQGRLDRR